MGERYSGMTPEQEAEINKQIDILTKEEGLLMSSKVKIKYVDLFKSFFLDKCAIITVIDKPCQDSEREEDPVRSAERDLVTHYQ